jgi:hypothetical protein
MWPYQNQNYGNPYLPEPQMQVTKVNGRPGADAFRIGPNSSALLLDESGTLIWAITTDGAGYKTVAPYDIAPHVDAPLPDLNGLEERLRRLEEIVNGNTSNSSTARAVEPAGGAA